MNIRAVKFPRPPDKETAAPAGTGHGGNILKTAPNDYNAPAHDLQALASTRFEHMVARVHAPGPRPLAELLAEIATATGEHALIAGRVAAYARLDPAVVRALGVDIFPPNVLGVVR
jgi:hypothetical protein